MVKSSKLRDVTGSSGVAGRPSIQSRGLLALASHE